MTEKQHNDDDENYSAAMIADEKKLLRKIQLCTIPFICLVFFIEVKILIMDCLFI